MARRTKKEKKSFAKGGQKFGTKHGKEMRFHVSLILLSAILEIALFILLISLISIQQMKNAASAFSSGSSAVQRSVKSTGGVLNDPGLDFQLTIPDQMGEWLYKTGNIKSLVDDKLSDQYLQVYLPIGGDVKSRNLEDMAKAVLTIRKFTSDEWKKMDKGCQKNNQLYCDAMGTKIDEQNGNVYAYEKANDCSQQMETKCNLVDKIVKSFKLK